MSQSDAVFLDFECWISAFVASNSAFYHWAKLKPYKILRLKRKISRFWKKLLIFSKRWHFQKKDDSTRKKLTLKKRWYDMTRLEKRWWSYSKDAIWDHYLWSKSLAADFSVSRAFLKKHHVPCTNEHFQQKKNHLPL